MMGCLVNLARLALKVHLEMMATPEHLVSLDLRAREVPRERRVSEDPPEKPDHPAPLALLGKDPALTLPHLQPC
jgi:hypothetical protein